MGAVVRAFGEFRSRRLISIVLALTLGAALLVVLPPPPVHAAPCDAPITSAIACENSKPGSPSSEWQISGAGSANLQGFATDISVNVGTTIGFKIDTTLSSYLIDIYRIGYYGGNGARKVASLGTVIGTDQPACTNQSSTGLIDCGNWSQSASWAVPSDAVSGIYFALLHTSNNSSESHVTFIVRNDAGHSDLFFQTSDTTWQAYNTYGGNSLYVGNPAGRAYKVSYNRPFNTNSGVESHDFVWNAEYPMVRFLEANGYDVSYTTGVDTERRGDLIKNHKTFLSVGHDEYWSGNQRANVEAARDAGVNLAFFSGNEVFWKTRWENSIAGTSTSYRTLVTYKETSTGTALDPQDPPTWTGTWRDPRLSPPADGGRPENNLTGTMFNVNCCTTDMHVSGSSKSLRFWRNTRVANLGATVTTTLGSGILGYEWDESPDNGFRPAGLIHLSSDTQSVSSYLQDYGWSYAPGTATHHLALYRAPSGALVFGAGTIQWAWGLDNNHVTDGPTNTADVAVQQATVNLLADMGAQPATLQSGLAGATASTDTTAPVSTISAPADGATVPVGSPVSITGNATDVGGVVAGVEVSVDGGTSWHPATGTGSWSYSFTPATNGTLTIKTRATDDSARTETPGAGRTITVGTGNPPPSGSCPCSIWPASTTPAVAADPDATSIEVGVKFRASQTGSITGIRFYKGTGNTGTHIGSLWSATGTKLASATFSNESATGWQQADFTTPVPITANTTYVASYLAPSGHYSVNDSYFVTSTTNGPLSALADGADGPNGVYQYGAGGFPTSGYAASNYWVDVVFSTTTAPDTTKPTITARTPSDAATDVATSIAPTATFSEPVTTASVAMSAGSTTVAGTTTYDTATQKVTFTPTVPLANSTAYTVTVSGAKDAAGNVMDPASWSFTTVAAPPPDTTPPTVTARTPASGATGVATNTTVAATFSEAVQASTATIAVNGPAGAVAGSVSPTTGTTQTITFTPAAALASSTTYTVTVSGAKDVANNTMAPTSWSFTTAAVAAGSTIWADAATPGTLADPDTAATEVGVKFRTTQTGKVTAIRFYKGPGNTGTHIGTLWSRTGTKLATVTFSGETASGWQQATFATPVTVTANTTYVASYNAPAGHYSVDENYFATAATTRGPLTALKNGTDGVNGVYRYGGSAFPSTGYHSSNYWVDVVFVAN
ncbi:MAG TPA: N,N-dimethylformamidase beta subunit family domain-containing protein [Microlunatus sp.]|nr:N,N-dimethylformamidase beta subunit family domain-containing protein [Microlunatus sp.]